MCINILYDNIQKHFIMKKLILALFVFIPILAQAYDVQIDGVYYNLVEGKAEVTSGDALYSGSITIPSSIQYKGKNYPVTTIGYMAFRNCSNLISATIPNSVETIGHGAFSSCSGLTSFNIPNSVKTIEMGAFTGCSNLKDIMIPASVIEIAVEAFGNCTGLMNITVAEGNSVYDSRNKCNAIIETATNRLISGCARTVIPEGVTAIGSSAFSFCSGLASVTLPKSVKNIGYRAFHMCSDLTNITIPDSVTVIDGAAFYKCSKLTNIIIPDGVTCIENDTFGGCTLLESIIIPDSVTSIGYDAFKDCSNLKTVTLGKGVKSIDGGAFKGCTALNVVYCNATDIQKASAWAFENSPVEMAKLYVPATSLSKYKSTLPWSNFGTIIVTK